jgi:hypothetical protein
VPTLQFSLNATVEDSTFIDSESPFLDYIYDLNPEPALAIRITNSEIRNVTGTYGGLIGLNPSVPITVPTTVSVEIDNSTLRDITATVRGAVLYEGKNFLTSIVVSNTTTISGVVLGCPGEKYFASYAHRLLFSGVGDVTPLSESVQLVVRIEDRFGNFICIVDPPSSINILILKQGFPIYNQSVWFQEGVAEFTGIYFQPLPNAVYNGIVSWEDFFVPLDFHMAPDCGPDRATEVRSPLLPPLPSSSAIRPPPSALHRPPSPLHSTLHYALHPPLSTLPSAPLTFCSPCFPQTSFVAREGVRSLATAVEELRTLFACRQGRRARALAR